MRAPTEPRARGTFRRLPAAVLGAVLAVLGCERPTAEGPGGETHFLKWCDEASSGCGDELRCLNHVCTLPCEEDLACRAYPGAACMPEPAPGSTDTSNRCDLACAADADCGELSALHRCDRGVCRARAGACVDDGVGANQVLVIGDSFFGQSHQVTAFLEKLGRETGALSTGERYRDNSSLLRNSLAEQGLATQYATATAESEVKVVIMNGGGADVLAGSCEVADASCPALAGAARGAEELFQRMADDGVLAIVYAFYPDPLDALVREKVDALRPLIQDACAMSPTPCHWIDLRTSFAGHYDEYILPDGLNPTSAGAEATASAIWATLEWECVAQ